MKTIRVRPSGLSWVAVLLLSLPLPAAAQENPASRQHGQHAAHASSPGDSPDAAPDSHAMHGTDPSAARPADRSRMPPHDGAAAGEAMDHSMHAMGHGTPHESPAPDSSDAVPESAPMHDTGLPPGRPTDHSRMHSDGAAAGAAMDHSMHAMGHGTPHAHGAPAPGEPRSPDYSDGIGHGDMPGMQMIDDRPLAMLRVDQLEATRGRDAHGQAWALQGWYGNDTDKLWLRSEGERRGGRIDGGAIELLWSRAVAPFWDRQLGVREDLGRGPARHWVAFGVQGLAPYWFELEATAYAGPSGRMAARLRVEYELLFTQRLILQPDFEANLYGRDDPARRIGRGLSDTQFALRLRYEVRREFAPYVGVAWTRRHGATATYARQDGESPFERQWVAGVRFWF